MFSFLKKNKDNNDKKEVDNVKLRREQIRCVCTQNKYMSQRCTISFEENDLVLIYENGEERISYNNIESYGKIENSKYGIQEALNKKILTQGVMQSPGFLAGNFYTLTSSAKIFLYIKYKIENGSIQTFLAEYNEGVEKAIKFIDKKMKR